MAAADFGLASYSEAKVPNNSPSSETIYHCRLILHSIATSKKLLARGDGFSLEVTDFQWNLPVLASPAGTISRVQTAFIVLGFALGHWGCNPGLLCSCLNMNLWEEPARWHSGISPADSSRGRGQYPTGIWAGLEPHFFCEDTNRAGCQNPKVCAWENGHYELVAWGIWGIVLRISKNVGKISVNKCLIKYLHNVRLCSLC